MKASGKKGTIRVVLIALLGNLIIALSKFVVYALSGSVAILSEGIHSVADTGNQILLLIGARRSKRPADEKHSFGYGKEEYFWAFMVALLLFFMGGIFSIYEGIHKIIHPEPIKNYLLLLALLAFAIIIVSLSFYTAYSAIRKRSSSKIMSYLKSTTDSNLIVIYLEDMAALMSLAVALLGVTLARFVSPVFDGIASVTIGAILTFVAWFLSNELRDLLIGEGLDRKTLQEIRKIVKAEPIVKHLNNIRTMNLGNDSALVVISVDLDDIKTAGQVEDRLEIIRKKIKKAFPIISYLYIDVREL
jgi:cation diffusion facilitator family transporter